MVLNQVQPAPVKGEYLLQAEPWGQHRNPYDHPLHGLAPRRQVQPRLRAQRQVSTPIEQEEHYLAIVRGKDGRDHLKASGSLRHVKRAILSKIVREFEEAVQQQDEADYQIQSSDDYKEHETLREPKDSLMAVDPDTGSISVPVRRKRARASTESGNAHRSIERGCKTARVRTGQEGEKKIVTFQLQDEEGLKQWYENAFDAVQQVTCRTIAKLWIKKIEPKKQSAHPYNGGLPKEDPKDPERTKPNYWPDSIPHKEPDHIQKDQRKTLLTHLITNTPHQQLVPKGKMSEVIGAAELEAQSAERKNDFPPDKWEILQHIFRVRHLQEAYLSGGQDGSTVVYLPDCSKAARVEQGEPVKDIEDVDVDVPLNNHASEEDSDETEHAAQALLTPASSTMTSPADQQRMQGHNINNPSSSFSTQDGDVQRQQMEGYDDAFERSMASDMNMMERRNLNGMAYPHHPLAQTTYSLMPILPPQYPQQSMHLRPNHQETPRWVDFNADAFNRVSHMGAPVQPEPVIPGYGVFSNADMGNLAAISDGLPSNEEYFHSQARMEQIRQRLQQQDLTTDFTSQPPRDIPYRAASAQSNQHMNMTRHNSYDHGVLQNTFYQQM